MSYELAVVAIGGIWVSMGVVLGVVMGRRGHNAFGWLVLGTVLGPLAVILAIDALHHDAPGASAASDVEPATLSPSSGVDILAGVDGSPEARAALESALALLGTRAGRVTLAGVIDYDAASAGGESSREQATRGQLAGEADRLRDTVAARVTLDVVVLHGPPALALAAYAAEHGYDLLVVGRRGRGLAKSLIGSVAKQLAAGSKVPVLVDGQG